MITNTFQTDLKCQSCVAKLKPVLDADERVEGWSADTSDPRKTLSVHSRQGVSIETVNEILARAGFRALKEVELGAASDIAARSILATYYPLLLVVGFIAGVVAFVDLRDGVFNWRQSMNWFMAGFFLVFAFFKLLNLSGFVSSFQSYDVLARRVALYGYGYPFIELALGIAYLMGWFPLATNAITTIVMSVGLIGVTQTLLANRKIQCACLGTVFNLPMSIVTFVENSAMIAMAIAAMVVGH